MGIPRGAPLDSTLVLESQLDHGAINYRMLLKVYFLFLSLKPYLNAAEYLLFPKSSEVEIPCDDRRAYRCSFVHCDLLALQKASSIIIPQPPFQNKVFARRMQWTVKGQFLTEFEVSFFQFCILSSSSIRKVF